MRRNPLRPAVAGLAFACALLMSPAPSEAALLVDPSGGTVLNPLFGSDVDDGNIERSIGGTFTFYGTDFTSVSPTTNGYIAAGPILPGAFFGDRGVGTLAALEGTPVFAPFYDDLYLDGSVGNTIIENVVPGVYYALTYSINGWFDFDPGFDSNFQLLLILSDTTIGGFSFTAGQIAFSYGAMNSTISDGTATIGIGLNEGNLASLPGTTDGQITDYALIPTGPNFVLFTPDGQGGYTASIAAVPEPGSIALTALGAALIGLAVARRRRPA